ncbi:MAG: archaellin/type IV pilin N-terminal domain-containing protein [Nitrososphaerales archaeon]
MPFKEKIRKRQRRAITPVIGAVLMIAVTIAVGFATWAWAKSSAQNSELNFGNAIGSNINYLKENFEAVNANFSSSSPQSATLWLYNNGNTTVYIKQIWISNITSSFSQTFTSLNSTKTYQFNCYCLEIHSQSVVSITLSLTSPSVFQSGVVYQFKSLGVYGNTNTFQQTR